MGYFNNQTGYPTDILSTRAIIKRGNYALIPPNGLVRNVIPGFENCDVTILSTPKLGATFVDYLVTLHDCGRNTKGFGGEELETFVYVIDGAITASADATDYPLTAGGYLYCPAGVTLRLENANGGQSSRLFLQAPLSAHQGLRGARGQQQRRQPGEDPLRGHERGDPAGSAAERSGLRHEYAHPLLRPGASHGYIETHVQEHGAYILSGAGVYNLDNEWMPVKQGDYIFMGAYVQQAGYAVGQETFSYIYSRTATATSSLKRFAAKTKATCSRSVAFFYLSQSPTDTHRAGDVGGAALQVEFPLRQRDRQRAQARQNAEHRVDPLRVQRFRAVLHHAGQRDDRQAARPRQTSDAGQRLAAQRLAVDAPFAGDQQIGLRQRLLQAQRRHHDLDARLQRCTEKHLAGDPHAARRSAAGDLSHVAAGTLADHLGILRQALLQLRHHRCRRALLRPEHRRRAGPTSGLSTSQATSIRHCRRRASSVLRSIPLSVASSPPPHGSALPSGR